MAAAYLTSSGIKITGAALYRTEMHTRIPFRYGIATVTRLPHIFLRLTARINGAEAVGIAADHLAPKWFTKDPATPFEDDITGMLAVHRRAAETALALESAPTPFALWQRLYAAQAEWGAEQNFAPLLVHFGTSLVERALIDAVCRAAGTPFATLLRTSGGLGVRPGDVHPEIPAGAAPGDLLPDEAPLPRVLARHTVGLSDPLTDADRTEEHQVADGLPVTLEECVAVYGLRHFKLKIGSDTDRNLARLEQTLTRLGSVCPTRDWAYTLDGNESYTSVADFRAFWEAFRAHPALRDSLPRLLFVEQPLHRAVALAPATGDAFAAWPDRPPVIIDESDAETGSLPAALALGYAGTSHKNCKGVFKGVANACLLAHRRRQRNKAAPLLLLSGEDLSNVGPVALPQDLAVQAALGIRSVERNGHHYFAGLSMFPPDVQEATRAAHPELYHIGLAGFPTLTVTGGELDLGSVNAAPFGVNFLPDLETFAQRL